MVLEVKEVDEGVAVVGLEADLLYGGGDGGAEDVDGGQGYGVALLHLGHLLPVVPDGLEVGPDVGVVSGEELGAQSLRSRGSLKVYQ